MRVAGSTTILTILIVLSIIHESSLSNEQFHDASFLDQLDKDIINDAKNIFPVPRSTIFKERQEVSGKKDDESQVYQNDEVLPCFRHHRQSFLTPVEEKFTKKKMLEQQVDCSDPSIKNVKINGKGCYIEIFYNVPARRIVSKLRYRFLKVCCSGYKGKECNKRGSSDDALNDELISTDIDVLGNYNEKNEKRYSNDEEGTRNAPEWNGSGAVCKHKCNNGGTCVGPNQCQCPSGFAGDTCTEAACRKPCLNGGKCIDAQCSCDSYWKGSQCETPICANPCKHGDCVMPNTCTCQSGWTGFLCDEAICQRECKNGGKCVSPNTCACTKGFEGVDCGYHYCSKGCGVGGSCVGPEKCLCAVGRAGPACETAIVKPTGTPDVGGGGKIPADPASTCTVSGHAFFKTFDDKFFTFPGRCTYQLAGDCIDRSFAIHVSIDPKCAPLYDKSCKRSVFLFFRSDIIVKLQGSVVSVNNVNITLPYTYKNLVVKKVGDFIMVEGWNGLKVRWDKHDGVYVTMTSVFQNKTCGLCGNYDGNSDNDFKTFQGRLTNDVATFGNSWARTKVDETCLNVFQKDLVSKYDNLRYSEQRLVDQLCDPLINGKDFNACHDTVDSLSYFIQCREEVAGCSSETRSQCVCNTFTQYSRACARKDVVLDWRTSSLCPAYCTNRHVHTECGTSCPKTCHNLLHHSTCRHSCVDGCFCPPGLVSNGTHCVNEYQCTCTHEKKIYKNGESINKDCNKCYCTRGRWKCTERNCPATCTVHGDPHYKTFDGKWFDFDGSCKYVLARDVNQLFTVVIENVPCSSSSYMVDSCAKSLRVHLNESVIQLQRDRKIVVDGVRVSLPYNGPGVTVKEASSLFIRLHASIGLDILYNGETTTLVTIDAKFLNKTLGLCGTFDRKQENDFTTPDGNIDTNAVTFGNSWKLDPRCKDSPPTPPDPCEVQPQRAPIAEKKCNKLKMAPFSTCHKEINPDKFMKVCKHDVCGCVNGEACLCEAIATYVHECALKGVIIDWRNEDILPECAIKCPANQVYQECGSLCKRTCRDLSSYKTCTEQCVPGCNCRNGTVMNELGSCVIPSECTCHSDGNTYSPLETVYKEKCTKCVCVQGIFNCTHDECDRTCPGNQVWTDKKISCAKTCENLHLPCLKSINSIGCHCPDDTVWDANMKKCVQSYECPCHHNGKSYYNGQSYKYDCNMCTCRNSQWRCTTKSCAGTCSVYGDPHYTTFDGKKFHFEGRCDYILSEDHCDKPGTYRIQVENVACGTTGATCSKSVTITLQDTMILLQRGQRIRATPVKTGAVMKARYKLIKTTFFDIIHAEIGITIMWDRGTRLVVSLQPKFKGRTCGLCGNFNGNQEDDFTSPEGDVGITPEVFGDSYKVEDSCPDTKPPVHPCEKEKYRASWSHKQCSIINRDIFKPCHVVVDPRPYFDACYYDTCGCDMGGDCECLCTAVAAYAQVCNSHGVHIKWRSQEFCPVQCETCEEYKACGTSNPQTCANRCQPQETLPIKCVEGCFCPNGTVRDHNGKCIKIEECSCYVDGVEYPTNSMVIWETEGCHRRCKCKAGCLKECIDTCTTTARPTTKKITTPATPATTPKSTRGPTTQLSCTGTDKHKCFHEAKCINSSSVCDGRCDCKDCTDERGCTTSCPPCSKLNFKCHKTCQCVAQRFVCDRHCDCQDCTDEIGCATTTPLATTRPVATTKSPTILCPHNKIVKVCVKGCEEDCHFLQKSKSCHKSDQCRVACGCPTGLFNNGTHCVPPSSCECYDEIEKKFHSPGESWDAVCSVCTCFNNNITCSPKPCPTTYCPPEGKLVKRPGSCCPVCECPTCPTPTPRPHCWEHEINCTDAKGRDKCIPKSWICDGEKDCDIDEINCPTPTTSCNDKLGLGDSKIIPDRHFIASSFEGINFRPSNARINPTNHINHNGGSWCAESGRLGPHWISVDLGAPMQITKVATKGQLMTSRYVVTYRLLYSLNGESWDIFREEGREKLFPANSNWDTMVINKLPHKIIARYVRIDVESYVGRPCLRMELYGCGAHASTPVPTPTRPVTVTTKCPEFLCEDQKTCIPMSWVCNNKPDCPDKSDEKNCNGTCRPGQFKCKDGKCIDKQYVCDGDKDCRGGEDEKDCKPKTCSPTEFPCPNGRCIRKSYVCDKECDCLSCADERNCTTTTAPHFTSPTAPTRPKTTIPTTIYPTHPKTKAPTTKQQEVTKPYTKEKTTARKTVPTTKEKIPTSHAKVTSTQPTTPTTEVTSTQPTTHPTTKKTTKKATTSVVIRTETPKTVSKSPQIRTSTPATTACPQNSTCLCENTCSSLSVNPNGCASVQCIDECKCPKGYLRNNRTGYCDYDIHCACVLNGRIYKVGDVVTKGECQQCICKTTGFVCVKHCPIKHCPEGQELTHPAGECCKCAPTPCKGGRTRVECGCPLFCPTLQNNTVICDSQHCQNDACMCPHGKVDNGTHCVDTRACHCSVDGTNFPAGSRWRKGDCQECKCVEGEVICGKVCLINSCPSGYKLVNGSGDNCCYCQPIPITTEKPTTVETTKITTAQTTMPPTTPAGKCETIKKTEHYVDSEGCKSKIAIDRTKCTGRCPSETIFDFDKDSAVSDCKCCKPFEYRRTSVPLICPNGKTKQHNYYIFLSCSCYGCAANPFGKDLPIVSSDEYALR